MPFVVVSPLGIGKMTPTSLQLLINCPIHEGPTGKNSTLFSSTYSCAIHVKLFLLLFGVFKPFSRVKGDFYTIFILIFILLKCFVF